MGKLIIVPTPIGNLEDITLRALRMLKEASLVLCEDTRTTRKLLNKYDINTPTSSYHKFNEHQRISGLIKNLKGEEIIVLVSDAGTPGISDPGFLLVRACIEEKIEVECLPGPSALIPALVVSGFPTDRFVFEGFIPHSKGRQKRLMSLENETRTMVFYESPYRICKTLGDFVRYFGSTRNCCVVRELSKIYEEHIRGNVLDLQYHFQSIPPKGEFVIVLEGMPEKDIQKKKTEMNQ